MRLFSEYRAGRFLYGSFPVILPLASGFIVNLLMAKVIVPQSYSVIPQSLALVGLATTIAYIINHDVAAREIAVAGDPRSAAGAFFAGRVLFSLIGTGFCLIPALWGHGREGYVAIPFILWFLVNVGINENLGQAWRCLERYESVVRLYITNFLLTVGGAIYLYFHDASPFGLGLILLFSSLATTAIFIRSVAHFFKKPDYHILKGILRKSRPVAISGLALFVSNWFGVIYLSAAGASDALTYYFLAGKFAAAHLILLSVLYFAYIPSLSKMCALDRHRVFKRWLGAIIFYAVSSSLAVAYLVIPLFIKFWGPQYQNVQGYYLRYLPWIVFACLSYYIGLFIYADGRASVIGRFQTILAFLTALGIVFGYSKWGAVSLPLAEGLAMLVAGLIQYFLWHIKPPAD